RARPDRSTAPRISMRSGWLGWLISILLRASDVRADVLGGQDGDRLGRPLGRDDEGHDTRPCERRALADRALAEQRALGAPEGELALVGRDPRARGERDDDDRAA